MKPVILIGASKHDLDNGNIEMLRTTWLRDCKIPYQIFVGRTVENAVGANMTVLDAPDGLWVELTYKTRRMMRWAAPQAFTHVFRCDVDTLVHMERLLASGFEAHDYFGSTLDVPTNWPFCHGGPGFWLSMKAVRILADAAIDQNSEIHKLQDQWIGDTLGVAGINPAHDPRFSMGWSYGRDEPRILPDNDTISCHMSKGTGNYDKKWMREAYDRMTTANAFTLQYPWIKEHGAKTSAVPNPNPTSKVLIACNSCWKDVRNGSNAAIRDTWGKELPAGWDLRFFMGDRNFSPEEEKLLLDPNFIGSPGTLGELAPATAKKCDIGDAWTLCPDEVMLHDVPDGYLGLPWKTVESLRWALELGYDYIFRIFTDTYVFVERLYKCGFESYDALGVVLFNCPPCPAHPDSSHFCPLGGDGYWTSRKAAQAILYYTDAELEKMTDDQLRALGAEFEYVEVEA